MTTFLLAAFLAMAVLTRPRTALRRFVERATGASLGGNIDLEAGVIRVVKILGGQSGNGREYTAAAMRAAVPKYEGVKVFLNHPNRNALGEDRKFGDWVGVLESVHYVGPEHHMKVPGLYGDLHLRKGGKHYEEIIAAAMDFSQSFGLSHVADGDSVVINGMEVVESINEVFSVDIVMDPATNSGLFEARFSRVDVLRRRIALLEAKNRPLEEAARNDRRNENRRRWDCIDRTNEALRRCEIKLEEKAKYSHLTYAESAPFIEAGIKARLTDRSNLEASSSDCEDEFDAAVRRARATIAARS